MIKHIITTGLLLMSFEVQNKMETGKPAHAAIYDQIIRNVPKIDKRYAARLSMVIYKKTLKYGLEPRIFTAMLAQESKYNLGTLGYKSKRARKPIDFGIAQINKNTIKSMHLDKNRLLTDMEYSVEAGTKVLADFKHTYGSEKTYWTHYNSGKTKYRNRYLVAVSRYL